MANTFRSDSEEVSGYFQSASPLIGSFDPPLFYSLEVEDSLHAYFLPQDGQTRSEFLASTSPSASMSSSSRMEFYYDLHNVNDDFVQQHSPSLSPDSTCTSPQPEEKPVVRSTRRPLRYDSPIHGGGVRKRGRPSGSKSDSKMAVYAKAYREQKKQETRHLAEQVAMLDEDREKLLKDNDWLREKNNALALEIANLRRANDRHEQTTAFIGVLRNNPGKLRLCIDQNSEPYLEAI